MAKSISALLLATADLRHSSVITESEINSLKKRWSGHGKDAGKNEIESYDFMERVDHCLHISEQQANKGRRWWAAQLLTAKGHFRNTQFSRGLSEPQRVAASNIARFELVDWEFSYNKAYSAAWAFPVYRVHGASGFTFDYIGRAWQSGGVEVL